MEPFLFGHPIPVILVGIPFVYLVIRDIVLFFRRRSEKEARKIEVAESEKKLYNLMKNVQKNRTEMMENLENIRKKMNEHPAPPAPKPKKKKSKKDDQAKKED